MLFKKIEKIPPCFLFTDKIPPLIKCQFEVGKKKQNCLSTLSVTVTDRHQKKKKKERSKLADKQNVN